MTQSKKLPPRLAPDLPLPVYSYVPGRSPHPISHPQGHSYGVVAAPITVSAATRWRECSPYIFGIDLFNYGFYWEAHESWEAVWRAAREQAVLATYLKGLIKLAAAGVKLREQRPSGVRRHATRAAELLISVQDSVNGQAADADVRYWGVAVHRLASQARSIAEQADELTSAAAKEAESARLPVALRVEE